MCPKNVTKYQFCRHHMCSFKLQMHQKPFSAGMPRPRCGSLRCSPRSLSRLERGCSLPIPFPPGLDAFCVLISAFRPLHEEFLATSAMLLYCFECCRNTRYINDFFNCYFDDYEEYCSSAAYDFYFTIFSIGLKRQLAAANCTLRSNLYYLLLINCKLCCCFSCSIYIAQSTVLLR